MLISASGRHAAADDDITSQVISAAVKKYARFCSWAILASLSNFSRQPSGRVAISHSSPLDAFGAAALPCIHHHQFRHAHRCIDMGAKALSVAARQLRRPGRRHRRATNFIADRSPAQVSEYRHSCTSLGRCAPLGNTASRAEATTSARHARRQYL